MDTKTERKDTSTLIYIDDKDPEEPLEPKFAARDVLIKRGVDAKKDFELLSEIGRGKFGTVYKCKEKETGLELAAKYVPIPKREDRRNVEREVEIMNSLQHHLIIQLYAAYEHQKMMCVVLELVEGGELFDRVIDEDFVLTEKVCAVFMRQICEAMQFIHKNNILHLDLKPENILCLSREGNRIKIIDFGLARKYDPDKKLQILFGTPEFVAPEVVNFDCISYGTDMWSVGVICYVLLSGLSPFMGETDIETMANVTIAKYDFDDEAFVNVSSDALDFITKLLVKDISVRMTATECLEHKWLKRKPKPPIPPKPLYTPPPKFITTSPTPPREIKPVELETTKDNLKNFIERWEEHPNSPYVFDNGTNVIAPIKDTRGDSSISSRACSPSPCDSISTTTEDIDLPQTESTSESEKPSLSEKDQQEESLPSPFKGYLQSFDRRKSDTNFILNKKPAGETINLADEIRKLSDHLLMLSEINTKLEREIREENNSSPRSTGSSNFRSMTPKLNGFTRAQSCIEDSDELLRSPLFRSPTPVIKVSSDHNLFEKFATTNNRVSMLTRHLQSLDETPNLISNGKLEESLERRSISPKAKPKNGFRDAVSFVETTKTVERSSGVPWPVTKRTKFRVNQTSRDVPVGSPDTHQSFNLEDAKTTKDCLLHLLERYHDRTTTRTPTITNNNRHSSISIDWNMSDNLEQKSISSVSAFFRKHAANGRNVQQIRAQLETKGGKSSQH